MVKGVKIWWKVVTVGKNALVHASSIKGNRRVRVKKIALNKLMKWHVLLLSTIKRIVSIDLSNVFFWVQNITLLSFFILLSRHQYFNRVIFL